VSSSCCDHSLRRVTELLAIVIKALGYGAALTGAGSVLARATLWRDSSPSRVQALASLIRAAGGALMFCVCVGALLFLLRLGGIGETSLLGPAFLSPLGAALALQFAGGLWLAVAASRPVALGGAMLIVASFGVVGHSATLGLLTACTVVLHVAGAGWWLGGLWLLLLHSREPGELFLTLVRRFSRQAPWVVTALLASAVFTAVWLLDFRFDPATPYVRGLLVKSVLVLLLLGLAGLNRFVLVHGISSTVGSRRWLVRTVAAELLLIATVLAVTAWLTSSESPH